MLQLCSPRHQDSHYRCLRHSAPHATSTSQSKGLNARVSGTSPGTWRNPLEAISCGCYFFCFVSLARVLFRSRGLAFSLQRQPHDVTTMTTAIMTRRSTRLPLNILQSCLTTTKHREAEVTCQHGMRLFLRCPPSISLSLQHFPHIILLSQVTPCMTAHTPRLTTLP